MTKITDFSKTFKLESLPAFEGQANGLEGMWEHTECGNRKQWNSVLIPGK